MKFTPSAALLAAVATHSLAHPVQNTQDSKGKAARRDDSAAADNAVDWNDPANYEGIDWNDPALYKDVDWSAVNYDGSAEAAAITEAPEAKRQDWNDPEIYKDVDWSTVDFGGDAEAPAMTEAPKVKRQDWNDPENYNSVDWNDPEIYKDVDWSTVNYDGNEEAAATTEAPKVKRQDWNDPENYKSVDWSDPEIYKNIDWVTLLDWTTVTYGGDSAATAPTQTPSPEPTAAASSSADSGADEQATETTSSQDPSHTSTTGECNRLGPILNATIAIGRSCKTHCNQYVDRVNSLVSKMDAQDCDIDHYATKPYLPNQTEEVNQREGLQARGTMSCDMLSTKLASMKQSIRSGSCGSECAALGKRIGQTTQYMARLGCGTESQPAHPSSAQPIQRRDTAHDVITAEAKNAYDAWESGLGAPAPSANLSSSQKQQICDHLESGFVTCAAEAEKFIQYNGGNDMVPRFLIDWRMDIAARERAYRCASPTSSSLNRRDEPTNQTTAQQLEATLPPSSANSSQRDLVCDYLRKEQLQVFSEISQALLHGEKPDPSLIQKLKDIEASEKKWDCPIYPPQPLKARQEPTPETTAKELEVTLPPSEARPDQKALVCDSLRKEQLQVYSEMSKAYLSGGKPDQSLSSKMETLNASQEKWDCGPYPAQPLKKRQDSNSDNQHIKSIEDGLGKLGNCETSGGCCFWC